MAKVTRIELVDDLDGGVADGTVRFALNNAEYEIDLSAANNTSLQEALAPYINAAVKVRVGKLPSTRSSGGRERQGKAAGVASSRDQSRAIRDWAASKGIAVSDRGRIKQEIVDRYHAEAGR